MPADVPENNHPVDTAPGGRFGVMIRELTGAASGPVPPVDPQRLNAAGSVCLTRPSRPHFIRTRDEFAWRTNELLDAIATGTIKVAASAHYPLEKAA
jgi:NADPH2:quinone reductase